MSVLGRALRSIPTSGLQAPQPWLTEALTGGTSYSGRAVGVDNSMRLVPVYSAVALLAGTVGSLPLMVYRRLGDDSKERAPSHRTWRLLHDQPNPEMAADEVWEMVEAHLLLWGNAFLLKIRDSLGQVSELWPIRPSRVVVGWDDDGRYFGVFTMGHDPVRYREVDILHIRALGTDGLVGMSPIQQARQMLGGSMEMEEFTNRFWSNSAYPGGVLQHPNKLSKDAADRLKETWRAGHGGAANSTKVAVLEEGMTWQSVGMPLADAQFLETRNYNNLEVALLFRIPPRMLGAHLSKDSLTYTTTELEGLDFLTYSVRRWLVRIEKSLLRDPSIFLQGQRFYAEFLVDALLRAATKDRYDAYAVALDPAKGWMDRQEVRSLEGLPQELAENVPEAPAPGSGGADEAPPPTTGSTQ